MVQTYSEIVLVLALNIFCQLVQMEQAWEKCTYPGKPSPNLSVANWSPCCGESITS